MNSRSLLPLLAALAILALLGAYVGGYYWLGVYIEGQGTNLAGETVEIRQRIYSHYWQIHLFTPGAWVESSVRGGTVSIHHRNEFVSPSLP